MTLVARCRQIGDERKQERSAPKRQRKLGKVFDTEFGLTELEQDKSVGWQYAELLQTELQLWSKHFAETGFTFTLWVKLHDEMWAWWDELDWDFSDEGPSDSIYFA